MRNVAFFILELKVYDPRVVGFFCVCVGFFHTFDSVVKYTDSVPRYWGGVCFNSAKRSWSFFS